MIKVKKNGKKCWVTFTVSADDCKGMSLKGSWDDWKLSPMKQKKNGDFYITKILPANSLYEFGYITDSSDWITDDTLPTVSSPFGSLNSVLEL